jgi:hypothetical protein
MYKKFKKFLTIFMVSLMWTQLGYGIHGEVPEGFKGVKANHFDTSSKTPKEIEALKQEARKRLGLKDKYDSTEEEKQAIAQASEEHFKKAEKTNDLNLYTNIEDAHQLLHQDLTARETAQQKIQEQAERTRLRAELNEAKRKETELNKIIERQKAALLASQNRIDALQKQILSSGRSLDELSETTETVNQKLNRLFKILRESEKTVNPV